MLYFLNLKKYFCRIKKYKEIFGQKKVETIHAVYRQKNKTKWF